MVFAPAVTCMIRYKYQGTWYSPGSDLSASEGKQEKIISFSRVVLTWYLSYYFARACFPSEIGLIGYIFWVIIRVYKINSTYICHLFIVSDTFQEASRRAKLSVY